MGLRHDILAALAAKHPEIVTLDDLMDATGERDRARLVSNLKAAQTDALIEKTRDEVTNQPAYKATPTGLARHKNGQQQYNGKPMAENIAKGKIASGDAAIKPTVDTEVASLLNIIYDIRAAIGDPTGKIMLGDLSSAVRERIEACQHHKAEAERQAKRAHDLGNDAAGYAMQIGIIRTLLDIAPDANIVEAVDAILGMEAEGRLQQPTGRLAMLLIDSADMTDIEELDTTDLCDAQAEARHQIDVGNAARALVISIHGEAYRRTEWKDAA